MITDSYLQQLARRIDGDRKAMRKTLDILHAMIDRKLWKQPERRLVVALYWPHVGIYGR